MAEAYVTLVTSTDYVPGVETLAFSLRESGTSRPILCLATPAVLTDANIKSRMLRAFDAIVEVDLIDSRAFHQLQLLGRPELGVTFTKLHVWNLTQFKRAIYLDADTLVLRNIDDLFTRDLGTLGIAAAPDVGWPDCFNSGLFVCEPNAQTFVALKAMAAARTSVGGGSFDGADQGLLNEFFRGWSTSPPANRLAFTDNLPVSGAYDYAPAFVRFGCSARVVHFIGPGLAKPW
ncbi:nucleotide-diphospho-sugar transferase, partial [Ramicandelaber brevisporus]